MKLTILISTMNESIQPLYERLVKLPEHIDVVICHQITNNDLDTQELKNHIESIRPNISVIQKYEKGLSKSRNCALSHVHEGICLVTDDDVEFVDDLYEKITQAYLTYPNIDIITFQAKTPEGIPYKSYKQESFQHNILSVAKVSSIEITFKAEAIHRENISFDEQFGLGGVYQSGEEYVFLTDAIRHGLKAQYFPLAISIHPAESSGKVINNEMFIAKGAMMHRVFGYIGNIFLLLFALKKYSFYKNHLTFLQVLGLMRKGKYQIKKHKEKKC